MFSRFKIVFVWIVATVFIAVGVPSSTAVQAKTAQQVYHLNAGNVQAFAVQCQYDGSVRWLQQGDSSAGKCPFIANVTQWYVPANYSLCMRPTSTPGVGCQFQYSGGTWWGAPQGSWTGWTVHN